MHTLPKHLWICIFLTHRAVDWKSGVAEIGVGSDLLVSVLGKAMA